jgi:hypothetical protein
MKIIPPHKVTAQLLDIIHEAEQELILVSPYVDFTSWQKPVAAIKNAMARNVKVTFYIRSNQDSQASRDHVRRLGLTPVLVENLHAKIYLSEKDGMLTSMNLLRYSDSNSIEIGSQIEQPAELAELRHLVHRFIAHYDPTAPPVPAQTAPAPTPPLPASHPLDKSLLRFLRGVDHSTRIEVGDDRALKISAFANRFTFRIDPQSNLAAIDGILSGREADRFAIKRMYHFTNPDMHYQIVNEPGEYTKVRGTYNPPLSSSNPDQLTENEHQRLHRIVAEFLRSVSSFKNDWM